MNGNKMVSLNHPVPGKPFSITNNTVKNIIHTTNVLKTLRALNVLKPSFLVPAITPKNPSVITTATNAKY